MGPSRIAGAWDFSKAEDLAIGFLCRKRLLFKTFIRLSADQKSSLDIRASPRNTHFQTKRSSRQAERSCLCSSCSFAHHLSASLTEPVEEGGVTGGPQRGSVLAFRLNHLFLNRHLWPRHRSQLTSFFLSFLTCWRALHMLVRTFLRPADCLGQSTFPRAVGLL
jgi:hypothetical protein